MNDCTLSRRKLAVKLILHAVFTVAEKHTTENENAVKSAWITDVDVLSFFSLMSGG